MAAAVPIPTESNAHVRIERLKLFFRTQKGIVQAVDNVSFTLDRGRAMVIIGESGSGKSSLARAILRLLPRNVADYSGSIHMNGVLGGANLMELGDERFRKEVRWVRMAFVPQAAMNALNPVIRIHDQVVEPLLAHKENVSKAEAAQKAHEAFARVGLPIDFLQRYPFELSGGMRQRVAIATALVMQPDLVVLDEPTSALDVLTQANVMNLLKRVKKELGITFILITHDIATASEVADEVAVMYAGQMVERSDAKRFYGGPLHPYSQRLMASVPSIRSEKREPSFIVGQPPSLINPPTGCRFADRCPQRFDRCSEEPPFTQAENGRWVKCWLYP